MEEGQSSPQGQVTTKVTLFSSLGTWFIAFCYVFKLGTRHKRAQKNKLENALHKVCWEVFKIFPLALWYWILSKNLFLIASHRIFNRQNPKKR
jgi:hypothetical protein